MFNLHDFIFNNLVSGYKNGSFTKEQVSIYSVNYMTKGLFTETDVEKLNEILSEEPAEDTVDSVAADETTEEITNEITTEEDLVSVENSVIDETADCTEPYADALVADPDAVSSEDSTSEITAEETSDSTVEYAEETTTGTNDSESRDAETE